MNGIMIFRNWHKGAENNPHTVTARQNRHRFPTNVSAGAMGYYLIGPCISQKDLLRCDGVSSEMLEDVSLRTR
jgi:hypothetical protein